MSKKLIYLMFVVLVLGLTTTVANAEISDGLVAYWPLDEGTGTTTADVTGNGSNGTFVDIPVWVSGKFGSALDFDGTNDAVNCGNQPILDFGTGDFTISLWVNVGVSDNDEAIFGKGDRGGTVYFLKIRDSADNGDIKLRLDDGTTQKDPDTDDHPDLYTAPGWHHLVAMRRNSIKIHIFVDGVDDTGVAGHGDSTLTADYDLSATSENNAYIGAIEDTPLGKFFDGSIDDVAVWARALTDEEVAYLWNNGNGNPIAAPLEASNPTPADGEVIDGYIENGNIATTLEFTSGNSAASHEAFFSANLALVDARDAGVSLGAPPYFVSGPPWDTMYYVGDPAEEPYTDSLVRGTTYYWCVDEANDPNLWAGPTWSFTVLPFKAWDPVPEGGQGWVRTTPTLSWAAGTTLDQPAPHDHDVYFGTTFADVNDATYASDEYMGHQDLGDETWEPVADGGLTLNSETDYYWRIDEGHDRANKPGSVPVVLIKGDVWSFTTAPPFPMTDPNLVGYWTFDEDVGTPTAFDWSGHDNHGTINGDLERFAGVFENAMDFPGSDDWVALPTGMVDSSIGSVCFWIKTTQSSRGMIFYGGVDLNDDGYGGDDELHVNVENGGGIDFFIEGEPDMEIGTAPLNDDDWYHIAATWDKTANRAKLYIDGGAPLIAAHTGNIFNLTGCIRLGRPGDPERYYSGLLDDVRVYDYPLPPEKIAQIMRIDPSLAWNPSPVNGATVDVELSELSWTAGDWAESHDVYFGTDKTAPEFKRNQTGTTYPVTGLLQMDETYYWRIDEHDPNGVHTGNLWSFWVANYLIVDDIEDYNDWPPDEIWATWIDGWEGDPPVPGSVNGSTVGYPNPDWAAGEHFVETTIVHGGMQSMPLFYDNTGGKNYSEATRTFAGAQNWTRQGVKALTLSFRGYLPSVGSFSYAAPIYTMTADGANIGGTLDEFHYAYKQMSGTGTIEALVLSVQNTHAAAKAGVMIRDTLDVNSIHALVNVTPTSGVEFLYRDTAAGTTVSAVVAGFSAPHWVKLERGLGGLFTAYHANDVAGSPDTWVQVDTATITMSDPAYAGLALTSHNVNATCEATFSDVKIQNVEMGLVLSRDIGITSNEAERMYVRLSDGTYEATVAHVDPNAALLDTWQEWNIALSDFTAVNSNLSLGNIAKMTIGLGNPIAPSTNSEGLLFIDDIVLYVPRCFPSLLKPALDFSDNCVVDYLDLEIMAGDWLEGDEVMTTVNPGDANLVAHWPLDVDFLDISGNNLHGIPMNGASLIPDPCRVTAANFDGVDDYVDCGNPTDPNTLDFGTGNWSVCAWVKTTMLGTGGEPDKGVIYGKGGDASGGHRYGLYVNEDQSPEGGITLVTDDNVDKITVDSSVIVSDGEWHHVVGLRDVNSLHVYVDGILDGTNDTLPVGYDLSGTHQHNAYIGAITDNSIASLYKFFEGSVDDVRIYDRALSDAEAAWLAAEGAPSLYIPLVSPAELYTDEAEGDRIINFKDYAELANAWLEEKLWPAE